MKHTILSGLVLVLLFVVGGGESAAQLAGGAGGPSGSSPEFTPGPEPCFDVFLGNMIFCQNLHCTTRQFIWFTWLRCDEVELAACLADARAIYEACLAEQGS
jgi:hypothetical protein